VVRMSSQRSRCIGVSHASWHPRRQVCRGQQVRAQGSWFGIFDYRQPGMPRCGCHLRGRGTERHSANLAAAQQADPWYRVLSRPTIDSRLQRWKECTEDAVLFVGCWARYEQSFDAALASSPRPWLHWLRGSPQPTGVIHGSRGLGRPTGGGERRRRARCCQPGQSKLTDAQRRCGATAAIQTQDMTLSHSAQTRILGRKEAVKHIGIPKFEQCFVDGAKQTTERRSPRLWFAGRPPAQCQPLHARRDAANVVGSCLPRPLTACAFLLGFRLRTRAFPRLRKDPNFGCAGENRKKNTQVGWHLAETTDHKGSSCCASRMLQQIVPGSRRAAHHQQHRTCSVGTAAWKHGRAADGLFGIEVGIAGSLVRQRRAWSSLVPGKPPLATTLPTQRRTQGLRIPWVSRILLMH
jgi:hypothetical protein